MDEKHWGKFGSAENGEEWATAHFRVFVAIEIFGSMSRNGPLCRDRAGHNVS